MIITICCLGHKQEWVNTLSPVLHLCTLTQTKHQNCPWLFKMSVWVTSGRFSFETTAPMIPHCFHLFKIVLDRAPSLCSMFLTHLYILVFTTQTCLTPALQAGSTPSGDKHSSISIHLLVILTIWGNSHKFWSCFSEFEKSVSHSIHFDHCKSNMTKVNFGVNYTETDHDMWDNTLLYA